MLITSLHHSPKTTILQYNMYILEEGKENAFYSSVMCNLIKIIEISFSSQIRFHF